MRVKEEVKILAWNSTIERPKIMASSPITSWQIEGEKLDSKITADVNCRDEIKRHLLLERKAMTNLGSILKSRHHFANNRPYSQSYGFPSSCVWMRQLVHKEGWTLKNRCFRIAVLEKTLESPLGCKEIKTVNPKGNQHWIFTGRTTAKAETLLLWPADVKGWFIGKDPDAGKDWGKRRRGQQRIRWLDNITDSVDMNLSITPRDNGRQKSLECCSPRSQKESDVI